MDVTVIGIVVVFSLGVGAWLFLGGEKEEPSIAEPESGSFRCKVCGKVSDAYLAANNHAVADHDLQGHKVDESIERA